MTDPVSPRLELSLDTQVTQSSRTASRVIEGRAVVVVMDAQALHTLNQVGTYVWERADGRSIAAIVEEMVDDFEVDRDQAIRDVLTFVETLVGLRALDLTQANDTTEPL